MTSEQFHPPKDLVMALAVEAGELVAQDQWQPEAAAAPPTRRLGGPGLLSRLVSKYAGTWSVSTVRSSPCGSRCAASTRTPGTPNITAAVGQPSLPVRTAEVEAATGAQVWDLARLEDPTAAAERSCCYVGLRWT